MDRYGRQKPLGPKGKQSNDDQVMHTDFCDEFASLHVQCMSMNGYGSFCGGAQCCSCYDTGYGSFGGFGNTHMYDSLTPAEIAIMTNMAGAWEPICSCHFTCNIPYYCFRGSAGTGSGPGGGRGWRKGGRIKKRRRR